MNRGTKGNNVKAATFNGWSLGSVIIFQTENVNGVEMVIMGQLLSV